MLLLFLFALSAAAAANASRILVVAPSASKSHNIDVAAIVHTLKDRGHHVTFVSPYGKSEKNLDFVFVGITNMLEAIPEIVNLKFDCNFFETQINFWNILNKYAKFITKKPQLHKFLTQDNSHFDLVITEEFYQPVFHALAHKYQAPLIVLSTFGPSHYMNNYAGNPLQLAYSSHEFTHDFGDLNLAQRLKNLVYTTFDLIGRYWIVIREQNALAKELFGDDTPDLHELERNVSLVLLNSHFSLNGPRAYLPNTIEIAGVHMKDVQPLDKPYKDILDNTKHGVVLLSFGSIKDLSENSEPFVIDILNALGKLKQDVILKWTGDKELPVKHKNIHPFKWMPQNDILAHPNLKVFVTHGGLHSAIEVVHHGVPIICIPFVGDQFLNCERTVSNGYGISMDNKNFNGNTFYKALTQILSDRKFKDQAVLYSKRFTDRPLKALDNAIYWIEYVIRHKGCDFIKSPKHRLRFYEYLFLDILVYVVLAMWLIKKIITFAFSKVFGKSKSKNVKVKRN